MLKQVASGVLCVDLVSLLITLGMLWSMANSNHDALRECSWCLPCIDAGSDGYNNSCKSRQPYEYVQKGILSQMANLRERETNVDMKKLDSLRNLIKTHRTDPQYFWSLKPAAYVAGKEQPKPRIYDHSLTTIRAWELADSRSYLMNGMQYRNGRIVVPADGLYYIYSFLDIFKKCNITEEAFSRRTVRPGILQKIFKYNIVDGKEKELLSTVKSPRPPLHNSYHGYDHVSMFDSSLSAGVKLSAGDEIYVKVSNISLVRNSRFNHFGAYML